VNGLSVLLKKLRDNWKEALVSLLTFVVLVAVVQWGLSASHTPSYIFPTPWAIAKALGTDLQAKSFWSNTWATAVEVILGCLIGSLVGFILALLATASKFFRTVLTPYMVVIQAIPKVAVAPIIVVALGYGLESKVVVAATISFFPLFINVVAGIDSADPEQLELMRSLRASRLQTLRWVQLPAAVPTIAGGLEMAFVFSVVGAIVGEFAGASKGLGYLINQRSFNLNQAGVFSALIVLSVMALILDVLVRMAASWMLRWQRAQDMPSGLPGSPADDHAAWPEQARTDEAPAATSTGDTRLNL
jgi:NitT/TauT family transport system permease protein